MISVWLMHHKPLRISANGKLRPYVVAINDRKIVSLWNSLMASKSLFPILYRMISYGWLEESMNVDGESWWLVHVKFLPLPLVSKILAKTLSLNHLNPSSHAKTCQTLASAFSTDLFITIAYHPSIIPSSVVIWMYLEMGYSVRMALS